MRGFEGLDVGDQARVELTGTDVERGFIDFAEQEEGRGIEDSIFKRANSVKLS